MEDLAVFIALNHSGSFRKYFVKLKKKKCYVPAKGRSGQQFQDLGHDFSPYGPPNRQITHMYEPRKTRLVRYSFHLLIQIEGEKISIQAERPLMIDARQIMSTETGL